MAEQTAPPDISDAAKVALALQMLAIADRIIDAATEQDWLDVSTFVNSLTDPTGVGVDEIMNNIFEGTHITNIASIETAKLRDQLADPKFRKQHPYVMIVSQPDARLSHRVMDGYVMTSEEALYSPFLPPYGFGCRCVPVALTVQQARDAGLVGAAPVGTLEQYLTGKGLSPTAQGGFAGPHGGRITPGPAPGFQPAFSGTDTMAQLEALRTKADEIRAEDPEAWAALSAWLLWLFGFQILTQDPPQQDQSAA